MDLLSRLWRHSVIEGDCWVWRGTTTHSGYGHIRWEGKVRRVHRVAFVHFKGEVPDGKEIDHLCRTRLCWNPDHLEAVTHTENMRRAVGYTDRKRKRCKRDHELTPENVYVRRNGQRMCRACIRLRDSARPSGWERQRAHEHDD